MWMYLSMRKPKSLLAGMACAAIGSGVACLEVNLENRPCTNGDDCIEGYVCSEAICIPRDELPDDSALDPDVLLAPEYCHAIYPADKKELLREEGQAILLGTLLPTTGDLGTRGPAREKAIYLAVDEINDAGGIDGKPVVMLSCDSGTSSEQAQTVLRHMVEVAKVPAVIGCASSQVTLDTFEGVAFDSKTLMISPSATSTLLSERSNAEDDGLLWRTAPSDAGQGYALAGLLKTQGVQKVGVISRNDSYGSSLRTVMQTNLCAGDDDFDFDCLDNDVYVVRGYTPASQDPDQTAAVTAMEELNPDAIVVIGLLDDGKALLQKIAGSTVLAEKPVLVSDALRDVSVLEALGDSALRGKIIGTFPAPSGENYFNFNAAYQSVTGDSPTSFTAHSYDAAYVLAYAIGASNAEEPTGLSIRDGIGRLVSGDKINVGSQGFAQTVRNLKDDAEFSVNLEGASGPLDFDLEVGEPEGDIEGWRFDVDDNDIESLGKIWDSATQTFIAPSE